MIKFPKIRQFENAVKEVSNTAHFAGMVDGVPTFNRSAEKPKLLYSCTVKTHGTNAAVRLEIDGSLTFQSRNRIITPQNDNAGFAEWADRKRDFFVDALSSIHERDGDVITVYGEWCGRNIQQGVAVNNLSKRFIAFGIRIGNSETQRWVDSYLEEFDSPEDLIFNTKQFPIELIEIDFNKPALVTQQLSELATKIGDKCPVGSYFGVEGIGEGVVCRPVDPDFQDSRFWFKVKDPRHSTTKTKRLIAVDPELASSVDEFVDMVLTETRLNQGVQYLKEMSGKEPSIKNTGTFLQWISKDIIDEEADRLRDSMLPRKQVMKTIGRKARLWYFKLIEE